MAFEMIWLKLQLQKLTFPIETPLKTLNDNEVVIFILKKSDLSLENLACWGGLSLVWDKELEGIMSILYSSTLEELKNIFTKGLKCK